MSREFRPTLLLLGCGYTLTRLLQRLSASVVIFTTRNEEGLRRAADIVGTRYRGAEVDLNSPSSLRDVFEQYPTIDTVIDSIPPFGEKDGKDPLTGVRNVCQVLSEQKIKRLVYLSTTGVYGINDGSEVNEQTPCTPGSSKAKARLDSENEYAAAFPNFTALRISAIYGPGRGLGMALKNGTYHPISGQDRWSNRVHVDDLVEAILCLLKDKGIPPKTLCVSDNAPTLQSEVVQYYCSNFSLPKPKEISQEEAIGLEMATQMSNLRVLNNLLRTELEMKFKYPSYKEGAGTEFA